MLCLAYPALATFDPPWQDSGPEFSKIFVSPKSRWFESLRTSFKMRTISSESSSHFLEFNYVVCMILFYVAPKNIDTENCVCTWIFERNNKSIHSCLSLSLYSWFQYLLYIVHSFRLILQKNKRFIQFYTCNKMVNFKFQMINYS